MPKLALEAISYSYREAGQRLLALQGVSIQVETGQFVTLIGPSGCGKSTLLQLISGLLLPDRGHILVDGSGINGRPGSAAYMPQEDALLPWRSILDNVILGAEIRGENRQLARSRARELIPLFGLEGFENAFPAQLSGGMRQRAALLRTFLTGQELILLDEPLGALDALTRRDLQSWLLGVWEHFGYTIVFVTHDISEAVTLSDRILVMSQRPGQVIAEIEVPMPRRERVGEAAFSQAIIALQSRLLLLLQNKPGPKTP